MDLGDSDSALAHFQGAVSKDSENPEYLLSLAAAYGASGHLNQAYEAYTAGLSHGSESVDAYRSAGQVALQIGASEQASTWFERAITISPSDIDSLLGAAKSAIARGDKKQADDRLMVAQQQAPNDPRVLLGVGQVRAGHGDYKAAMSAFQEAFEAGADPDEVRRSESAVLIKQGKHIQAAEAIREVLAASSDDHRLWHELATALEAGSDLPGADHAIGEALRISPNNPEYRLTLGRVSISRANRVIWTVQSRSYGKQSLLIQRIRGFRSRQGWCTKTDVNLRARWTHISKRLKWILTACKLTTGLACCFER